MECITHVFKQRWDIAHLILNWGKAQAEVTGTLQQNRLSRFISDYCRKGLYRDTAFGPQISCSQYLKSGRLHTENNAVCAVFFTFLPWYSLEDTVRETKSRYYFQHRFQSKGTQQPTGHPKDERHATGRRV